MEMDNIKISVIMPVYKVEEYVGKAIESIQAQTLTEFEFLIVDDGTPDKSGEICDAYAAQDNRIHVIHKENGGAPSARNVAIDIAKGKYLYFMDSDDWAEPDMLLDMYELAEKHQSQLTIAGFFIDTYYEKNKYITTNFTAFDGVFDNKEEFRSQAYRMFDTNMLYSPWNKLFLREYIMENNLRFPQTFWDDFPFILSVIRDVERVSITGRQYYHFIRAREESETASYRENMYEKREEEHSWMVELYQYWGVFDRNSKEMICRRYVDRFIGCVENLTNTKCTLSYHEKREKVEQMLSKGHLKKCLSYAKPKSFYAKCLMMPIKWQSVPLTLLECKVISFVKTNNVKLFATLKAGR